jgi:pimeloyl-ACP methyl ester carboxylesterase
VGGQPIPLEPSANDRLAELHCPVLVVAGDLDTRYAIAAADRLTSAAPNARAVIVPGVAHMVGMEVPDRLNELIVDFLTPLRPWR